jgi:hypothetical protein
MDLEAFVHSHESTIHLFVDLVLFPLIVWAVRRVSKLLHNVNRVPLIERRVDMHARVLDLHSDALERTGWVRPNTFDRVGDRRRAADFNAEQT